MARIASVIDPGKIDLMSLRGEFAFLRRRICN